MEGLPGIIECREATLTTPLLFDPGTAWEYGMNIDWVGKAIEAVTGQDLEQYLRGSVLDPLGMSATSFRLAPALRDELAAMNFRTPDGLVADRVRDDPGTGVPDGRRRDVRLSRRLPDPAADDPRRR